jgi:glycosyltransferase involved in cell wall biosynthesis
MKITVVTAVRNREATIGEAIASVACQTWPDIDHLVIDGASSDGTLAAIEAARHASMRLVSEPDDGIYDALNKGFALAEGEVVGLVHSDDFLAHSRVIEHVMAAFDDPMVDAVYGDLDYVSATNPEKIVRRWKSGAFRPAKLRWGWMPPHPALFVRRRLWEQFGTYDTRYRIAADYDAILRWFGKGGARAFYIPEVLVKMRVGGESNRSLERIMRKSREDLMALRANGEGGLLALCAKNLSKLSQFIMR